MNHTAPVIAIDGPSGSGKGTVAKGVARKLGWGLLDSGALYRVVALTATRRGVGLADEAALAALARSLDIAFAGAAVLVDGTEVTDAIRALEIDAPASKVAALPAVRSVLLDMQRGFRQPPGLVADGRDMGTVVFADAALKIFLTASAEARAERRLKQLRERHETGSDSAPTAEGFGTVRSAMRSRDDRDRRRTVAPLAPAVDAVAIDATTISANAVIQRVLALATQRALVAGGPPSKRRPSRHGVPAQIDLAL